MLMITFLIIVMLTMAMTMMMMVMLIYDDDDQLIFSYALLFNSPLQSFQVSIH